MSDPLGLSIGTTNLVATSVGGQSVTRRAVLTLPPHGAPVVGVPTGDGLVLAGFVDRVGDPVPLVATDGSSYSADDLLVEALEAMVGSVGAGPAAIAVPAHWTPATVRTLRAAIRANPVLAPGGTPPRLMSDAVAALTALRTNPGLNGGGPVVLLDFGGGGTSITLADAGATFDPLDETLRVAEFSGDLIDQAVLTKVLGGSAETQADADATAAVGLLGALRAQCRQAKERLSAVTATEVPLTLPGRPPVVRLTRAELEELLDEPFAEVLAALDNLLRRNRITVAELSAVAVVGGGASIPLVTQRLSEHTRLPVVSTAQPALDAATGAALFAAYAAESELRTGLAPIAPDAPTGLAPSAADAPTGLAPSAADTQQGPAVPGAVGALAWSQDDDAVPDPVPYAGPELPYSVANPYGVDNPYSLDTATRAVAQHVPRSYDDPPKAWQRLPILVFAGAGVLTLVALGGVAVALTGNSGNSEEPRPAPSTAPATHAISPPPAQTPPAAISPSAVQAPPPVVTVTTELPPPTQTPEPVVTATHTVTVTTTTQPTTTTTTTTTTTPSTTTTPPTTTTTTTTETTTPAMTTTYIKVPLIPVPIPIQVPNRGAPASPTTAPYPGVPGFPQ
ncbi:Hsp70 family protein [Mycolicibacterium sp. 120266]|uniref:Hsp70 family protein n=1 Tax=Mycolicibacterium sp. 120266 TaxID=3090601 RepID=UPI00299F19EB|nr:Hsp70 family protein [Mycolicibacterium sp. 120266]MDX1871907.1 Hsp70 family protein [Mycolicibacterium sp. 120266]